MSSKTSALILLGLCEVAALALWFSATAVLPSLQAEYDVGTAGTAPLFVTGTGMQPGAAGCWM